MSQGHYSNEVRLLLKQIGDLFKKHKREGKGPGLIFVRFSSTADRDKGMQLIRKTYGKIPWEPVDLSDDIDGKAFASLWEPSDPKRFFLVSDLAVELKRQGSEDGLATWLDSLSRHPGCSNKAVICIMPPSVRAMARHAGEVWKRKLGYLAWPIAQASVDKAIGVSEEEASTNKRKQVDPDRPAQLDNKETRELLKQLKEVESAKYLADVARAQLQAGELENARLLLLRAVEIYFQNSDLEGLAISYYMLGEIASIRADFPTALEWVAQAIDNWRVLDDPRGLSDALGFKGFLQYQTSQVEPALRSFSEAMELDERLGDSRRIAAGYRKMAMVFEKSRDWTQARGLYQKSLEMEEEAENPEGIARAFHHLGRVEEQDENYAEALVMYKKSLKLKEELSDRSGMAATLHQMGNLHSELEEWGDAITAYTEALERERAAGDSQGFARTMAQRGLAQMEMGDPEAALKDLVKAYQMLQKYNAPVTGEVLSHIESLQDQIPVETFNDILQNTTPNLHDD